MFGREAGEKAFGQVKESLSGLIQMIDEAKNNGTLDEVAESIGNALNTLINAIIKVTQFAYENKNAIIALAAGYGTFKIALSISNVVRDLSLALGVLTGATEAHPAPSRPPRGRPSNPSYAPTPKRPTEPYRRAQTAPRRT